LANAFNPAATAQVAAKIIAVLGDDSDPALVANTIITKPICAANFNGRGCSGSPIGNHSRINRAGKRYICFLGFIMAPRNAKVWSKDKNNAITIKSKANNMVVTIVTRNVIVAVDLTSQVIGGEKVGDGNFFAYDFLYST
jgi:hypothetical protein